MIKNFLQERDYDIGYHKALLDVRDWFSHHSKVMKTHKLYNEKSILAILSAMEKNVETMRDFGDKTEFVMNKKDGEIIVNLGKQEI